MLEQDAAVEVYASQEEQERRHEGRCEEGRLWYIVDVEGIVVIKLNPHVANHEAHQEAQKGGVE